MSVEPSDRARILGETISEVVNCLAPLAWPQKFGGVAPEHREHLFWAIKTLRAFLGDGSKAESSADLQRLVPLLPQIEHGLLAGDDVEHLAQEFFCNRSG